jgi:hypothetical protein
MLRHACGYALANKGHDARAIQGWLGHRSITTAGSIRRWRRTDSRISGGSEVGHSITPQRRLDRRGLYGTQPRRPAIEIAKALKIGRTSLGCSSCSSGLLGFLRIGAVEVSRGAAIQILDDDVVAFTRLIHLALLLVSTTFLYLCDCRLGNAEAHHADGNCHANECNSDIAQSPLPNVPRLSCPYT